MFKEFSYRYQQNKTDKEILKKFPIFISYLKMRDLKTFRNWDIYRLINDIKEMILTTSINDKKLELLNEILYERLEEVETLTDYISVHLPQKRNFNKQYKKLDEEWWFYYDLCYNDIMKGLFNKIRIFMELCKYEKKMNLQQEWEKEYPRQLSEQ